MTKRFENIPTNIITGFLGVGKTTAIRHLLQTRPSHEKWAVLVNEFGEVGIDGALLNADGIAVKEVPGGCMCCAVGVPSRAALNRLIREHNPDRILIEPTGLAHPKQVLDMFSTKAYQGVLDIQAVVCLADPWCLQDEKFLSLPAFNEQIAMADVLVASKADAAEKSHLVAFEAFAKQLIPAKQAVATIAGGELDWRLLSLSHQCRAAVAVVHQHHSHEKEAVLAEADAEGVIRIENNADFGHSCGWQFSSDWQFDGERLTALFERLDIPRIKGVFATSDGWLVINKMRQTVSSEMVESAEDSRVEMISLEVIDWSDIDRQIRKCRKVQNRLT